MRKLAVIFLAALVIAFTGVPSGSAQSQFGSVLGTVLDPAGAGVPDAKVVLRAVTTNVAQETATNGDGSFAIANVSPGEYRLSIRKENFRGLESKVTVEIGQTVSLNFKLELGKVTETIEVSAATLVLNTTSGELGKEITSKDLENLPNLTRNPYSLAALTAGAADTGAVTG